MVRTLVMIFFYSHFPTFPWQTAFLSTLVCRCRILYFLRNHTLASCFYVYNISAWKKNSILIRMQNFGSPSVSYHPSQIRSGKYIWQDYPNTSWLKTIENDSSIIVISPQGNRWNVNLMQQLSIGRPYRMRSSHKESISKHFLFQSCLSFPWRFYILLLDEGAKSSFKQLKQK